MRTLAIDYGARRTGLALSDAGGTLATPYDVLTVSNPDGVRSAILEVIRKEGVEALVVGLPLNMDGSLGPAARETIAWARTLEIEARMKVVFIDERLSSFAAEQRLVDRKRQGEKITRAQKKHRLDALAACGFLQEYLDGRLPASEIEEA